MNEYTKWIQKNKNNPNMTHSQVWYSEDTLVITGYDRTTGQGVNAVFKLDHCEPYKGKATNGGV